MLSPPLTRSEPAAPSPRSLNYVRTTLLSGPVRLEDGKGDDRGVRPYVTLRTVPALEDPRRVGSSLTPSFSLPNGRSHRPSSTSDDRSPYVSSNRTPFASVSSYSPVPFGFRLYWPRVARKWTCVSLTVPTYQSRSSSSVCPRFSLVSLKNHRPTVTKYWSP